MELKKIAMIATCVAAPISILGFGLMMGGGYKTSTGLGGVGPFNTIGFKGSAWWDKYHEALTLNKLPNALQIAKDVKEAGDLVISGSVLFSIFGLLAIASSVAWFIFRNK